MEKGHFWSQFFSLLFFFHTEMVRTSMVFSQRISVGKMKRQNYPFWRMPSCLGTPWITTSTFQSGYQWNPHKGWWIDTRYTEPFGTLKSLWKVQARKIKVLQIHVIRNVLLPKGSWRIQELPGSLFRLSKGFMSFGVLWMLFNMSFLNTNKKQDPFTKDSLELGYCLNTVVKVDNEGLR